MPTSTEKLLQSFADNDFRLHRSASDKTAVNWALNEAALRSFIERLPPNGVTAETGCGLSTALLATVASSHVCFTLDDSEFGPLADMLARVGGDLDTVKFIYGDTAATLPATPLPELDAVLIDGGHAFPYPVIDFHYLAMRLKPGGLLMIDDIWMPSVALLIDFLEKEAGWRRLDTSDSTASFEKVRGVSQVASAYPDRWDVQGINARAGARVERMRVYSGLTTQAKIVRHPLLTLRVTSRRLRRRFSRQ